MDSWLPEPWRREKYIEKESWKGFSGKQHFLTLDSDVNFMRKHKK